MTAPLVELTIESYQALVSGGVKIEQVSPPLTVGVPYEVPESLRFALILRMAEKYQEANACIVGSPRREEQRDVISFVLYHINR